MASYELAGLPLLEQEVAALVAAQIATVGASNPASPFVGGQSFATTTKAAAGGALAMPGLGNLTIAQVISRVQQILLTLQSLPQ